MTFWQEDVSIKTNICSCSHMERFWETAPVENGEKEWKCMSADNGIYILASVDQYRVAYAQAIENLYWSWADGYWDGRMVPTRALEVWGNLPYTRNAGTALRVARRMWKRKGFCERGICVIPLDVTWRRMVREARKYAERELACLRQAVNQTEAMAADPRRRILEQIRDGKVS